MQTPRLNRSAIFKEDPVEKHRRQTQLQIWLPLGLCVLVVVGLAALTMLAATQGSPSVGSWAGVSAIALMLPVFAGGFVALILLAALIYGLNKLLAILPEYTFKAQLFAFIAAQRIQHAADQAARPVVAAKGVFASLRAFWRALLHPNFSPRPRDD